MRVRLYHGGFCLVCGSVLMAVLAASGLRTVIVMVAQAGAVGAGTAWAWAAGVSRSLGVLALDPAIAVVFGPGLKPGLHHAPGAGGMGGR